MRSRLAGRACRNDASFDAPSPADERLASDSLVVPPLSIVSFYLIASPFLISFQFHPFDPSFLSFFFKGSSSFVESCIVEKMSREREREKLEGIGRRGHWFENGTSPSIAQITIDQLDTMAFNG